MLLSNLSCNIDFWVDLLYIIVVHLFFENENGECKMSRIKSKRRKAIIRRRVFLSLTCLFLVSVIVGVTVLLSSILKPDTKPQTSSDNKSQASQQESQDKVSSTVTVLSTGDIMVHDTQLNGAYVSETGEYDFSAFFKECAPYFKEADLNVANLEVTFGSTESGKYSGYPAFNTPDSLADAIKAAGLNMLLTANNHSYDTGYFGLTRTAQVLKQRGIDFIGTRETEKDSIYTVKEVNGINIGMANYTYSTVSGGRKSLNGNQLKEEAENLVSTFVYDNAALQSFYGQVKEVIKDMKTRGAEFIVFYMHWGEEYHTDANTWQKSIAQQLCNLGVDIIIGSHPHVIQPVELLVSEDSQNTTICLYSTGNAVSNQRQEIMDSCPSGHTEDGMLFSYTLKKTDGEVTLEEVDIIPTWVNRYRGGGGYLYTIYPLENPETDIAKYALDTQATAKAERSYERTKAIVAEGLTRCQD